MDFNETRHKYSPCEWALLKSFLRWGVTDHSHNWQICECYSGRGIHVGDGHGINVIIIIIIIMGCGITGRVGVPGVWVLARSRSWSLSFEGHSDSGPCLFHLDYCVISLQSISLLCNLFYN